MPHSAARAVSVESHPLKTSKSQIFNLKTLIIKKIEK